MERQWSRTSFRRDLVEQGSGLPGPSLALLLSTVLSSVCPPRSSGQQPYKVNENLMFGKGFGSAGKEKEGVFALLR